MSLIPAFDAGLWNAWIFMLYMILLTPLMMINQGATRDEIPKVDGDRKRQFTDSHNKTEKRALLIFHLIYFMAIIYSVFLPIKPGTYWFYIGLPVCLMGLFIYTMVMVNWATTPHDKPITKGIYRYSRHPMYISPFLVFMGVGIATASWVMLLCSLAFILLPPMFVKPEERFLLEKYGDSYLAYMDRTPRWIGIPKNGK
jgi:protein-S-isoprenylcysteine O-methyltransferase Ste14